MTDEDLAALALMADPEAPVDADAVSFWELVAADAAGGDGDDGHPGGPTARPLPEWYMPAPMGPPRRLSLWQRGVALAVVLSFLTIAAAGLCNTYGDIFH